ncbi:protein-L-isoaspartate(D-aspartate) O-methyltransferase [Pseudomarimonas arenosa]|uniref:Protein-L-isoaspartate O-methyltransferase n=1 Tax=Pseudomarimonas arenosa TaxID=2774145 RepID=A0AAW3ZKL1_9GAMM|nr:protein-L-isoaspartate(D-aspartate) O-methyltransferase [Pseudomarimonas arenosa]MBD8526268.1 protein-L-isoaspartate(D-aspartate) O-methyltransferase [Pseudomarimonas arenosa]
MNLQSSVWWLLLCSSLATASAISAESREYAAGRRAMLDEIAADARRTAFDTGRSRFSEPVMQAMQRVPRHAFVPEQYRTVAYANRPLPIGHGQTISQPYIVALMSDLLDIEPGDRVLEIGTGSGYQAAVLAELDAKVFSIEIIEPLAKQAAERLPELGYRSIELRHADGYYGWQEAAPFDAIIVTAAANSVPPPLIRQLKPGGVLVIPVGAPFLTQSLIKVEKTAAGELHTQRILPVRFVPLTGERE